MSNSVSKIINSLLFAFFWLVLATPGLAASPPSIQGKITEVRGYIMTGLTVRALNQSTSSEYETTSDERGAFAFEALEPGRYALASQCPGVDPILGSAFVEAGKTAQVELLALPLTETGNIAVDKFIASSAAQGGRYPAGNI